MAAKIATATAGPFSTALVASVLLHVGLVIALARAPREQRDPAAAGNAGAGGAGAAAAPTPAAPGRAGAAPAAQAGGRAPPAQAAGGDRPPAAQPEPPPEPIDEPPPPVFGVTEDSVVDGDSPVAVPVGNTVMMKPETPRPIAPAGGPARGGDAVRARWGTSTSKQFARMLREEKAPMPENAVRMGIGGQVVMRVGVDRDGKVRSVRVIKPGGHGFDEAAIKAMWKFRFSPCIDMQGRTVDCLLTYMYRFEPRTDGLGDGDPPGDRPGPRLDTQGQGGLSSAGPIMTIRLPSRPPSGRSFWFATFTWVAC